MTSHSKKHNRLIHEARIRLTVGHDPLHDVGHAERVARYASEIAKKMQITDSVQRDALSIAAWWHDVSRTIIRTPSFLWMPFVDDMLSGIMLMITIVKFRAFTRASFLALRLTFSKSAAVGRLFARLFLTRTLRTLVDILQDADTVDTLAPERTSVIHAIVDLGKQYERAYRVMTWWFASTTYLHVKTDAAKEYLTQMFEEFLAWLAQEEIRLWHIERYGQEWFDRMCDRFHTLLQQLQAGTLLRTP